MNKCIVIAAVFTACQLHSADINPTTNIHSLPNELKELISFQLAKGVSFDEAIENIKKLMLTDKQFSERLNTPEKAQPVIEMLSKHFNVLPLAVAFALGADEWLKKKYPKNTFYLVFNEIFQDINRNRNFIDSIFFIKLVEKLDKKNILDKLKILYPQYNELKLSPISKDILNKMVLLFIAGSPLLTDEEIMNYVKITEFIKNNKLQSTFSTALTERWEALLGRIAILLQPHYESDETLSGADDDFYYSD